jgi:asparagine synthase (glutamine-hydrolysing)
MCGIAGIIDYQGQANSTEILQSMLRSVSYRGPDESGIYNSPLATLGIVRLSIIDIATGQQPLSDPSGRYWIVFNGEIFNYRELRLDLEKKGYWFRTQSDTEVLLQLFIVYGYKCLNLLNGQFAFAVWDKDQEELFLARDRVGIRPVFFNHKNGVFTFASEIKAIFKQRSMIRELDIKGIYDVCTFWSTNSPRTLFKNIHELAPGHFLRYSRNGLKIGLYWQLSFNKINYKLSCGEAAEQLNELLLNATSLRLRADVEVAAYLSGGIDSTASVAYIKAIIPGLLNTFSVGFEEKDFDESNYQEEAVRYLNTNHKSITCSSEDIANYFPQVVWHSETSLLRTAPVPMFMLSRLVKDNYIKVIITGEGSDEILAGYDIFREAIIRKFWARQPESMIRPLLLKKIYSDIPYLRNASPNLLKMFFGFNLEDKGNPFYSHLLRWNNSNHIIKLFSNDLKHALRGYSAIDELEAKLPEGFASWDLLEKAQWLETTLFMSGYLLSSQGDRVSMANSVESRYPFLDYRVIEFCAGLPADYKLKGLNEKYLLKKVMKGKIPEIILRRPKQPYRAPIKSVFMGQKLPEYVKYMLSEKYFRETGIFDFESFTAMISRIIKTGISSEVDNMVLTAVISTHLLHYQLIENHNEEYRRGELKNLMIINDNNPL